MVAPVWFTPPVLAPSGGLVAGTSARQASQHMGRTKRRCSTGRSTPVAPGGTFPSTCTSCKCGRPPRSSARCADQPSRSNQFQPGWQQTRTQACWIGSSATQSCYQLQFELPASPRYRHCALLRISAKPTVNACSQKPATCAQESESAPVPSPALIRARQTDLGQTYPG